MARFSEIQQFPDFLEIFPEIPVPLGTVLEFAEFFAEWKAL